MSIISSLKTRMLIFSMLCSLYPEAWGSNTLVSLVREEPWHFLKKQLVEKPAEEAKKQPEAESANLQTTVFGVSLLFGCFFTPILFISNAEYANYYFFAVITLAIATIASAVHGETVTARLSKEAEKQAFLALLNNWAITQHKLPPDLSELFKKAHAIRAQQPYTFMSELPATIEALKAEIEKRIPKPQVIHHYH